MEREGAKPEAGAEEWRPIGEAPGYEVSSWGNVRTADLAPRKLVVRTDGYVQVSLYPRGGSPSTPLVHRLVAKAFLPNPRDLPQAHHKDSVRSNNRVENLEWVGGAENSRARAPVKHKTRERAIVQLSLQGDVIREWASTKAACEAIKVSRKSIQACLTGKNNTCKGCLWVYKTEHEGDRPGEEWRLVDPFRVSNLGRVKMPVSGLVIEGATDSHGYREVMYKGKHFRVHRLIAMAFLKAAPGQNFVNHKNCDRADNRAENLEWATQQENIAHAAQAGRMNTTPVTCKNGGEETHYASIADAARDTGVGQQNISRCARGGRTAGGYEWVHTRPADTTAPSAAAPAQETVPDDDPIWDELGEIGLTPVQPRANIDLGFPTPPDVEAAKIADDDPFWAEYGL